MKKCVTVRVPLKTAVEKKISAAVLFVLFGAVDVLYEEDSRVRQEIDSWKDGMIYYLSCGPSGPELMFGKKNNRLFRLVPDKRYADTCLLFKHNDEAFRVLTGLQGISGSYAAHGFILEGDIVTAMTFARVVDTVESYLFPRFMSRRILKEVTTKERSTAGVYLRIVRNALLGRYRQRRLRKTAVRRAVQEG